MFKKSYKNEFYIKRKIYQIQKMSVSPPEYELPYLVRCLCCDNFSDDNICNYCYINIVVNKIIGYTNNYKNNNFLYENRDNIKKISEIYDEIMIKEVNEYEESDIDMDKYINQVYGDKISYELCKIMKYVFKNQKLMNSKILFPIDKNFYESENINYDINNFICKFENIINILEGNMFLTNKTNKCIFCEKIFKINGIQVTCGNCYFSKKYSDNITEYIVNNYLWRR